jgi:hypothetical protein
MYIKNILYIVSAPTSCFDVSASSSGSLNFYFTEVQQIIKATDSVKSVD